MDVMLREEQNVVKELLCMAVNRHKRIPKRPMGITRKDLSGWRVIKGKWKKKEEARR